jgi:hypothetical protein
MKKCIKNTWLNTMTRHSKNGYHKTTLSLSKHWAENKGLKTVAWTSDDLTQIIKWASAKLWMESLCCN